LARLYGTPIPWPEHVKLDRANVVAHWAAEMLKTHGGCLIRCPVSLALRVSLAAQEEGLNLRGVTFMGGGEPPTPAKVRAIMRSGAQWIPTYIFTEAGVVGMGCCYPVDGNDLHFFKDNLALVQYPREVIPGSKVTVNSFYFTTLLTTAPKLMLNVESDDYGVVESRSCGCLLESYGYTEHILHIRSFRKLTGEGVTLVGSEMIRILEEVLPARFGGSPLDYQLLEEEDENGFTRISLLVSPKVQIVDESKVIEVILEAMEHSSVAADLARAIWSQGNTLRVKREEPIWTARGKLMPLHLSQGSER
jgi:phenylacetate-coenzyme A ligase PaaK-like adenylate-forming protein